MEQPHSQRHLSELSILGGILRWYDRPYLAGDVFAACSPSSFKHQDTRPIAESMLELSKSGMPIDVVTIAGLMSKNGSLGTIGGAGRLAEVVSEYGLMLLTESGIINEAKKLNSESRKDSAQQDIAAIVRQIQTDGVPAEDIAQELKKVADALEGEDSQDSASLDEQLDEYILNIDGDKRNVCPVCTPWRQINGILRGGVLPGELAILAARPSVGKSAFALNFAYSVACTGQSSIFQSLEMSRQQLLDRAVSSVGVIDVGKFRTGLNETDANRAKSAAASMRGKPLLIYDDTRVTVSDIKRRVRMAQRGPQRVGLVVIDYLQLLTPQDRSHSRERDVAEMSRELKLMAKDLSVPVLLLAQLNRKSEEGKRSPMLSDLRESGSIEQDADIVIFLHQARQTYDNPDEPVEVIVAKGRSSGVGKAHLIFNRKYQRFLDSSEQEFYDAVAEEKRDPYQCDL